MYVFKKKNKNVQDCSPPRDHAVFSLVGAASGSSATAAQLSTKSSAWQQR